MSVHKYRWKYKGNIDIHTYTNTKHESVYIWKNNFCQVIFLYHRPHFAMPPSTPSWSPVREAMMPMVTLSFSFILDHRRPTQRPKRGGHRYLHHIRHHCLQYHPKEGKYFWKMISLVLSPSQEASAPYFPPSPSLHLHCLTTSVTR